VLDAAEHNGERDILANCLCVIVLPSRILVIPLSARHVRIA
jgi:hypothetical protein